jgi:WbqC-like protein family
MGSMNCVILQPSYIPWRGYFHQIRKADFFIFYDDVQYDRHGWRNRNRVKTPNGSRWLTIPVLNKGACANHTPINEIAVDWVQPWNKKHMETIRQAYGKAPYYERYRGLLKEFYGFQTRLLADFTIETTIALAKELGIMGTRYLRSSSLPAEGSKTDRLLSILRHVKATRYISGPSARDYLEEEKFRDAGIILEYMAYDYPEYPQLYPPFDPRVSILDLLFMTGPDAPSYIW